MIKNGSFRRIITASFALIIVILSLYIFPKNEVKIPSKTIYKKALTSAIYLIDNNDYVARTKINVKSKEKESLAFELLNALINGTNKNKYLPIGFKSYIPKNTKINSIKLKDNQITVDFTSNLFPDDGKYEEKIIESIVYTLTEIDGITEVKILIDGNQLSYLPISGKKLPDILTRKIGINHKTRLDSFKNTKDVTTYFINNMNDENYYIPVTLTTDEDGEKIEIIIKELESKDNIDNNLKTYISAGTILKNYQILENEFSMEFNNLIFNGFDDIDEEVLYGLALSIRDNYDINKISIEVNKERVKSYNLKKS